nr:MAG TPA: hypothetical protein [Bacteriophage sp.]
MTAILLAFIPLLVVVICGVCAVIERHSKTWRLK